MAGFDKYLKTMLDKAATEARLDGSAAVEAKHLLLAISADPGSAAGQVLASAGLNRVAVREALKREFEHSLSVVGVSPAAFGLPAASPDPQRVPHLGVSVRLALERAMASSTRPGLQPAHLLLGILRSDVGTVPRALALAGVDRADLMARVVRTLTAQAKR
jgi:ATP-dependent Clp protease ATP-binding subunit ClpA